MNLNPLEWLKGETLKPIEVISRGFIFAWFDATKFYPNEGGVRCLVQDADNTFIARYDKIKKCFIGPQDFEIIEPLRWACLEYLLCQPRDTEPIYFKNISYGRPKMNAVETMAQNLVVAALTELHDHKKTALNFFTLGRLTDPQLNCLQEKIDNCLKILKHFLEVAHTFIPESMPILHDVLDWAKAILGALEPA
jgi:hypothetical protein